MWTARPDQTGPGGLQNKDLVSAIARQDQHSGLSYSLPIHQYRRLVSSVRLDPSKTSSIGEGRKKNTKSAGKRWKLFSLSFSSHWTTLAAVVVNGAGWFVLLWTIRAGTPGLGRVVGPYRSVVFLFSIAIEEKQNKTDTHWWDNKMWYGINPSDQPAPIECNILFPPQCVIKFYEVCGVSFV